MDFYADRYLGTNLPTNPDYAQLARDMGAIGIRVEDYGDVQDAVREAMASGRPAVIEGVIEGGKDVLAEPFRRDALKKTPTQTREIRRNQRGLNRFYG